MRSSTGGVGAWIRYGNPLEPGELDFAIAHYRAAILQPWETEAAARLKEARPDMTVLAYRCLSSTRDFEPDSMRASGLSYREARRRGWLARRDNGDLVEWNTYPGHFQARVWDPDYRARWVEEVGTGVEILATTRAGRAAGVGGADGGRIVAVRQGSLLATSFHPEVGGDHRVHDVFVSMVTRRA